MSTLPENRSSPAPKRMFNSPSAGRYTFRLNRQMPIPTRKRPATMSQKLLKVLHCIKDEKMTLPSFLEELFKSDDPHVAGWTEQFHNSEGAVRLLKVLENKAQVKEEDVVYSHNV
ncbi:hypothetical protein EC991_006429 [Linnemannia zychae]|nr:hypothetical protein EC991_006429 [Linnemannia zychae]